MEENNKLYMPANISAETELFRGITKKEMKHLSYLLIASSILAMIIGLYFKNITAVVLTFLFFGAISYFIVAKNDMAFSFYKNVQILLNYYSEQNLYRYRYTDFLKELVESEKENKDKK